MSMPKHGSREARRLQRLHQQAEDLYLHLSARYCRTKAGTRERARLGRLAYRAERRSDRRWDAVNGFDPAAMQHIAG